MMMNCACLAPHTLSDRLAEMSEIAYQPTAAVADASNIKKPASSMIRERIVSLINIFSP